MSRLDQFYDDMLFREYCKFNWLEYKESNFQRYAVYRLVKMGYVIREEWAAVQIDSRWHPHSMLHPDIIAKKGRKQYIIELKISDSPHDVQQAIGQLTFAMYIYEKQNVKNYYCIAVPEDFDNSLPSIFIKFLETKFGIEFLYI